MNSWIGLPPETAFKLSQVSRVTLDGEHHASGPVANGVAGDALVAACVGRAHILDLQVALGADVELATLRHLHTILGEAGGKGWKVMTQGASMWWRGSNRETVTEGLTDGTWFGSILLFSLEQAAQIWFTACYFTASL